MYLQQLGRELASIRIRNGDTLEKASEKVNVHQNTLSIYENDPFNMKLGKLLEFLDAYNVNPEIFFDSISEYIRKNQKKEE